MISTLLICPVWVTPRFINRNGAYRKNIWMTCIGWIFFRTSWIGVLQSYVSERKTLRCLFHLVDSRHGFLDSDNQVLDLLPTLPPHVQYVVLLTKADKRGGGMRPGLVEEIQKTVENKLNANTYLQHAATSSHKKSSSNEDLSVPVISSIVGFTHLRRVPVILTSSETRLGGGEVWSIMVDALAGDDASTLFHELRPPRSGTTTFPPQEQRSWEPPIQ